VFSVFSFTNPEVENKSKDDKERLGSLGGMAIKTDMLLLQTSQYVVRNIPGNHLL